MKKKNIDVSFEVSNSDISTMLVQSYLENLKAEKDALVKAKDEKEDELLYSVFRFESMLIQASSRNLSQINTAHETIVKLTSATYMHMYATRSEWWRNQADCCPDVGLLPMFASSLMCKKSLNVVASLIVNAASKSHIEIAPYSNIGLTNWTLKVLFTEDMSKAAAKIKDLHAETTVLSARIDNLDAELRNPDEIRNKVTARLTRSALEKMGGTGFAANILDTFNTPLRLENK